MMLERSLFGDGPDSSAIISGDGLFRYVLERKIGVAGPAVAILGVNPSTADATSDDATIRKDRGFGLRLGWGRIIKGNLFAFRATDVRRLAVAEDPVGPDNDAHLRQIMTDADIVIAAWGPAAKVPQRLRHRWRDVAAMAVDAGCPLMCFGVALDGQPRHTLMISYDTPLIPWEIP